jgi:FkbM family methyltransferase
MADELRRVRVNATKVPSRDLEYTSDHPCIEQVFKLEQYSLIRFSRHPEIVRFMREQSAGGKLPLIIDAGANIGASAVFFAMSYPGARIVAIEPEPGNFALLRRNADGLNVECLNAGLSSSHGRLKIADQTSHNWASRTETTDDGTGIPCVAIPDIYERECGTAAAFPFIVKIDVEGAEADVFARNTAWLKRTPIVMIELHDWLFPKKQTAAGFLRCIAHEPRDFIAAGENVISIAYNLTVT